jgi:hypothetical protein
VKVYEVICPNCNCAIHSQTPIFRESISCPNCEYEFIVHLQWYGDPSISRVVIYERIFHSCAEQMTLEEAMEG